VTGFDNSSDLSIVSTAGSVTAAITGSGTTYEVEISGMTTSGTVMVTILAGAAQDLAGNPSAASTSTDNTVDYDNVAPTVAMSSSAPDPTNTSPIPVTVTFSEDVFDFTADDITTNGTVQNFAGSGASYTFDLVPSGQGLVTANIAAGVAHDEAGNPNTAADPFSRTYDSAVPTVSLSSAAPNATNVSPIPVTVTFSEPVADFTADDITPGNGTVNNFAGSGTTYTFDLVPAGQGTVTADIAADVAHDAGGNGNAAATQFSRTYDTVAPTVTVNQAGTQADPAGSTPIRFTVVFNEPVTDFDDSGDVSIANSTAPGTLVATITGDGATYEVAVSGMTNSGNVVVTIPAGAAQDLATNPSAASTSDDNTVFFNASLRQQVQAERDNLNSLLPTSDSKTKKALQKAITKLDQALSNDLWQGDSTHLTLKGEMFFHRLRDAVKELVKIKNPPAIVVNAINNLVSISRKLAQTAIDEAIALPGNATKIAKAQSEMSKGDQDRNKGKYANAISHYEEAWEYAQQAVGNLVIAAVDEVDPEAEPDESDEHVHEEEAQTNRLFLPMITSNTQ
jgi:hypothetical protein